MATNTDSGGTGASERKTNGRSPTRGAARRARAKPESMGTKDSDYVETIVDPDHISERWEQWLETEFSRDFPLSNFPSGHAENEELLLLNRIDLFRKSHPPEESCIRGELREELVGDQKKPLGAEDHFFFQSYIRRIVSRMRRGERGWQQGKFDGVLSVSKSESSSNRSLKEKIFG